jgi:predicted enzyme related to lactoylglutathione lyase
MLKNVILLVRNVEESMRIYGGKECLNLPIKNASNRLAVIDIGNDMNLMIKECNNEAELSVGYNPILQFEVNDVQSVVQNILMNGGRLDGKIEHTLSDGVIASMKTPDNHVILLHGKS